MSKVKHIALFQFKDGTAEDQINSCFDFLMDISESIPGIENYVSGPNNSPEGMADGCTHGFVMTFTDAAARDAYLTHPEHERFKATCLPVVKKVIAFDFEL